MYFYCKKKAGTTMKEVMKSLNDFFEENLKPPFRITSVSEEEYGWFAEVEVIEEDEYMQKYGHDQLLGVYEVKLNNNQQVGSFERVNLRPRSAHVETAERR
ncbi:gas vesicle protein GvpO [Marinococcus luteus]|uniref:gas vesicle protein GvpO n=1 Tax=Marinococcus luteus TaxID=1122204 RepID=UPI002ACC6BDA|nr:gas vesicle protein GvpO [Marinococcus luteus]MDZ5783908.1 gas vesicle protein GvpO [Marinococcus luteus]